MDRDLLSHLPVILAVARRKSFVGAASELGMGASVVSHSVRLVEERLGVPLFARTTLSVALTEAGSALVASAAPALRDIGERVERIRSVRGRVTGHLRLNAPRLALAMVTTRVVREMAKRFPDVTVEINADDAIVNIVEDGFEAGIRLGEMIAEDMVTVRLTPPFRAILVASPDYLSERRRLKTCGRPCARDGAGGARRYRRGTPDAGAAGVGKPVARSVPLLSEAGLNGAKAQGVRRHCQRRVAS
jgi:DNA-binding transcriptional LysR family regulator